MFILEPKAQHCKHSTHGTHKLIITIAWCRPVANCWCHHNRYFIRKQRDTPYWWLDANWKNALLMRVFVFFSFINWLLCFGYWTIAAFNLADQLFDTRTSHMLRTHSHKHSHMVSVCARCGWIKCLWCCCLLVLRASTVADVEMCLILHQLRYNLNFKMRHNGRCCNVLDSSTVYSTLQRICWLAIVSDL